LGTVAGAAIGGAIANARGKKWEEERARDDKLAKALSSGELIVENGELKVAEGATSEFSAEQLSAFMDELGEEGLNNLREYGHELNALEASSKMYREQIEQNALAMTNLSDSAKTAASIYLSDELKAEKEQEYKDEWEAMSNKEKKEAALEMAKSKYSNAEDVKIKNGKIMYKVDGEWKEGEKWKEMGD
jgi:hypothetical protein